MNTLKKLEGKIAIITGAASGIGEAAARLFASHGATIVIADVQDDLGRNVAASIGQDKCSYNHCDVTDEKQVEELVKNTVENHGKVDVMYSNAGVLGPTEGILEAQMESIDHVLAINLRGPITCIKHAGRAMSATGTGGSIICTASVAAITGGFGPVHYTASKHGLLGAVKSAAGELGPHGIRVNCVSPYGVATPLATNAGGLSVAVVEAMTSAVTPLKGAVLRANHIAEAAMFLASDESKLISGQNLVVDGGVTAYNDGGVEKFKQIIRESSSSP